MCRALHAVFEVLTFILSAYVRVIPYLDYCCISVLSRGRVYRVPMYRTTVRVFDFVVDCVRGGQFLFRVVFVVSGAVF